MKSIPTPARCNARALRLAKVKFVMLPSEHTRPSDTDRAWPARALEFLRHFAIRVIGCLEAARP